MLKYDAANLLKIAMDFDVMADTLKSPQLNPPTRAQMPNIELVDNDKQSSKLSIDKAQKSLVECVKIIHKLYNKISKRDYHMVDEEFNDIRKYLDMSQISFEKALYL
jgi:hypothetical protein